jgi:hypothetical protein
MTALHITHSWGGGLTKWVSDFASAKPDSSDLILSMYSNSEIYGKEYKLIRSRTSEVIASFSFNLPITDCEIHSAEYATMLSTVINDYSINRIMVSTIIGHSIDVLNTKLPTLFIFHDYFPYCPALNIYFGGICTNCDFDKLSKCLDINPCSKLFRRKNAGFWIGLREAFVQKLIKKNIHIVFPHSTVKENLLKLDPSFGIMKSSIIPHGIPINKLNVFGGAEEGRKLRVLIPGRFAIDKGSEVLKKIFPYLYENFEVFAMGCGAGSSFYKKYQGVKYSVEYDNNQMGHILFEYKPDIVLLSSIVPETFSFTLSEMNNFSVPAIANNLGSFSVRIKEGYGLLYDQTAESLLERLRFISENREVLRSISRNLNDIPLRTTVEMVDDYQKIQGIFNTEK